MHAKAQSPVELANSLIIRGLKSSKGLSTDELIAEIVKRLTYVNYYRLTPYLKFYLQTKEVNGNIVLQDSFQQGAYWEDVWRLYMFDRKLRILLLDIIARIEVALRAQIIECWCASMQSSMPHINLKAYRPAYVRRKEGENLPSDWKKLWDTVERYFVRNKATHSEVHEEVRNAKSLAELPVWAFMEFTTLGNMESLLRLGLKKSLVLQIAHNMGFERADTFVSCISLLTRVRNACAHQSRVWNSYWRTAQSTPILRNMSDELSEIVRPDRTGAVLFICHKMARTIAPLSRWHERLKELLLSDEYPSRHIHRILGFYTPEWLNRLSS